MTVLTDVSSLESKEAQYFTTLKHWLGLQRVHTAQFSGALRHAGTLFLPQRQYIFTLAMPLNAPNSFLTLTEKLRYSAGTFVCGLGSKYAKCTQEVQ